MTWGFDLARKPAWHAVWSTLLLFGLIHLSGWDTGICYGKARGLPECSGTMMSPAYALGMGLLLVALGLATASIAWRARMTARAGSLRQKGNGPRR